MVAARQARFERRSSAIPTFRVNGTEVPDNRALLENAIATGSAVVIEARGIDTSTYARLNIGRLNGSASYFVGGVLVPVAILNASHADIASARSSAASFAQQQIAALGL